MGETIIMGINNLMKTYLIIWLVGAIASFVLHFFYPDFISDLSFWNTSIGWQREIALWNLGIISIIVYALIIKNVIINKFTLFILMIISILLGINHLFELIINRQAIQINLLGAVLNIIMAIWGGFVLKNEKYNK